MRISLSRFGTAALVLAAGMALGYFFLHGHPNGPSLVNSANAQTADNPQVAQTVPSHLQEPPAASDSPASATDKKLASEMVHTDDKGRKLAPHGTFYLLSYVSVKTDKGVEGFPPGEEVHFVGVDRAKHTLIVSNGRAEVEVSPDKLTNDLEVAAMVKRNDQAGQAKVAAYVQSEQAAYNKYEREAAEATSKDLENKQQEQQAVVQEQIAATEAAEATPAPQVYSSYNNGYYGSGGYGYGSPYSYFFATANAPTRAAPSANTSNGNTSSPNKVAAPAAGGRAGVMAPGNGATGAAGATGGAGGKPK